MEELKHRKVTEGDLHFSVTQVDFSNGSESGNPKFTGTAYSGQPIMNHPFWGNLLFDVDSMKSKESIPVLINHDMDRPAGHAVLDFSNSKVTANGELYGEHGEKATFMMKQGFPMQESVYIEPEFIEEVKKGAQVTLNGGTFNGPMTIFRGGMIKEVSLTPLGADSNTSTTTFSKEKTIIVKEIEMENIKEVEIVETFAEEVAPEAVKATEANDQVPAEDVKDELAFNEDKFTEFLDKLSESPKEAFEFACCDACDKTSKKSGKKKKEDEEFSSDLKAENEKLKAELEALKAKLKEIKDGERASKIDAEYEKFGLVAPENLKGILMEAEEEKFSALLGELTQGLAVSVDAPKKELFTATEVETSKDSTAGMSTVQKLQFTAKKLREANGSLSIHESMGLAKEELGL